MPHRIIFHLFCNIDPRRGGYSGGSSHVVKVHDCRPSCCKVGSIDGGAVDSGADGGVDNGFYVKDLDLLRCKAGIGDEDDWPVRSTVCEVLKLVLNSSSGSSSYTVVPTNNNAPRPFPTKTSALQSPRQKGVPTSGRRVVYFNTTTI